MEPKYTAANILAGWDELQERTKKRRRLPTIINELHALSNPSFRNSAAYRSNRSYINDLGSQSFSNYSKQMGMLASEERDKLDSMIIERIVKEDIKDVSSFDKLLGQLGGYAVRNRDKFFTAWDNRMDTIREQEKRAEEVNVAASEARGAIVYDKAVTEHLRHIREASPDTVQNRVAEAISDINNSDLSSVRKNAIREKYLAAASQAHTLGKSARGEEAAIRKEERDVNKELRAANKDQAAIDEKIRKITENKTEQLFIYNALKEINEANTAGTYVTEDGQITPMTPGMTMQREQEVLSKYAEKAFTAGVDIKNVQDGITAGIVNAPSTKHVIDTHATNPDKKHVYRSDREIELANAGGADRYIPVYDGDKLSVIFRAAAMAVLRKMDMDTPEGIELLQFINKVGPLNAAAQRPRHSKLIFDIMEEMQKDKNAWMQLLEGDFKGGSSSELRVRVRQ